MGLRITKQSSWGGMRRAPLGATSGTPLLLCMGLLALGDSGVSTLPGAGAL